MQKNAIGDGISMPSGDSGAITKTLLVMKLTFFLLMVAVFTANASGTAQTVTISGKGLSLKKVLSAMEKQTGYVVFANKLDLGKASPVTLSVHDLPLTGFLDVLLKDQPLEYSIEGKIIVLSRRSSGTPARAGSPALPVDPVKEFAPISGKVLNTDGQPLEGVSIFIKGSRKGTSTSADGSFTIDAKPGDILIISYTGLEERELKIASPGPIGTLVLKRGENPMDEVQIIAYGKTTRRWATGNVSSVKGEEIEKQPVTNPLAALSDRVPGLRIVQQTGVSGGTFSVQIRGQNSILNGNDPLYIIDGVPYTSTLLRSQGTDIFRGSVVGTSGNPLNFINLNNIERIDVLKDADATAIYGSRGANGVILITTKKGKAGSMAVSINGSSGIGKAVGRLHFMNTQQYLAMRREAFANDGVIPTKENAKDLMVWDTTRYTDWQDKMFGGTARFSTAQFGISGGNDLTTYNVSGIYSRQTTVFAGNFADRKAGINFNIAGSSPRHIFSFVLSGSYTNNINKPPTNDLTGMIDLAPNAPKIYNKDGSLNYEGTTFYNPFRYLNERFTIKTDNLISNFTAGFKLAKGLEFKTNFGINVLQIDEIRSLPSSAIPPFQAFLQRNSGFTDNSIRFWSIEPQLTWSDKLWKGKVDALVGATLQTSHSDGSLISAEGYTSDALLDDMKSAPRIRVLNTSSTVYKYNALFGRFTYNLFDKYLINLTGRRDGSSRFGPENRFQNFGAIGVGWIFTQESFMKDFSALSFGKIRASMGWTGNDQIGDYRFKNLYQSYGSPYQGVTGLILDGLFNPNLQWEANRKQEIALELAFLNNRITASASFYRNIASNQLVSYPLSFITGFAEIPYNLDARVQNKGWEFLVTTTNVKKRDLSWTTSANLSIERNKLLAFAGLETSPYASTYIVGQPITISKPLTYAGVDPATGIYQYYARDGKKTFSPVFEDRTKVVNVAAAFYGGFSSQLAYKSFSLDLSLQIVKQLGNYDPFPAIPGTENHNQTTDILDHWKKAGDHAPFQKYTRSYGSDAYTAASFAMGSDLRMADASFVRLKNVAISWKLPTGLCERMRLQNGRLYIQGQNLLTFTKYKGLDPETQSQNLPPLLMVVGGFQLTF